MIQINNKDDCCGCGACSQICPQECIELIEDPEGFVYPQVLKNYCLECGLCERACPIINSSAKCSIDVKPDAYIGYAKDLDIRLRSSSGGLFSLLAKIVLHSKGKVYGAAFDHNMMVHHIGISDESELFKLQGSKYLQSNTENCYCDAKQALDCGQLVLYSGTACQIAGLKSFLKKDYGNLITVDVLCHGAPSPKVWKKYLSEQEASHGSKAISASFRGKSYGWKKYSISIDFENGTKYERVHTDDPYMTLFLRNMSLRPSCYNCRFKHLDRESDITIGDCWGIEKYMPQMDDDRGTSVILVHTEKGRRLLSQVSDAMIFCEAETDKALPQTADSRKSVAMHCNRDQFFKALNKGKSMACLLYFSEDISGRSIRSLLRKLLVHIKR